MNPETVNALAQELTRRRALLVGEVVDTEAELRSIEEEREIELEELSQEDRAARLLAQLDDRAKHEIAEIDAALRRIAEEAYGTCESCEEPIAEGRLRALPATRFCVACASEQETQRPTTVPEEEAPRSGPIPPDLQLFSDRELETMLREQVQNDGRVDMDELRIVCRHGVVHLEGVLPSETEHSVLRQLIADVMGIEEIVDHIQIKEALWEREDRTKVAPAEEPLPGREPYGTEDVVESVEEGIDYVPPISPGPEEE
jgi:RNA polymerase-binding transcription factor DksA